MNHRYINENNACTSCKGEMQKSMQLCLERVKVYCYEHSHRTCPHRTDEEKDAQVAAAKRRKLERDAAKERMGTPAVSTAVTPVPLAPSPLALKFVNTQVAVHDRCAVLICLWQLMHLFADLSSDHAL